MLIILNFKSDCPDKKLEDFDFAYIFRILEKKFFDRKDKRKLSIFDNNKD